MNVSSRQRHSRQKLERGDSWSKCPGGAGARDRGPAAAVAECACLGVPDPKAGEAIQPFVVAAPGATLTEADVIARCRSSLPGYKVPKVVRIIDALPKSTVGKILRRELRNVHRLNFKPAHPAP